MFLFFTDCLELVSKYSIPPLEGLDVCPPKHPIYIIFSSLGIMPRVFIASHFPVAHDNLTRQIAICNDKYKFVAYSYSILQEFAVDNKMVVTSHSETVRKLHAWRTNSKMILKKIVSITYELDNSWDPSTWMIHFWL